MKRQYYITTDLQDLQIVEQELQAEGFCYSQIHVLSENDAEVEKYHLHAIEPVLKKDVVRFTNIGAVVGFVSASMVLLLAYVMQWHTTAAGWLPFSFLAVVKLGFCTWFGGFIGIQLPNYQFKQFQKLLDDGKHVFFVDISDDQRDSLDKVVEHHPRLSHAGTGDATPEWVVHGQEKFTRFVKVMP
jgi:hypothetical protein